MLNSGGRSALLVVLVAWMATTAVADPSGPQNDAGSGGDAGDLRSTATPVGAGPTYGAQLRPNDIDWFAASFGGASPSCIRTEVSSSTPIFAALAVEMSGATAVAPMAVGANALTVGGIAGMLPLTSTIRAAQQSGASNFAQYDFRMDRVGIPNGATDAGVATDAGDNIATAVAVAAGCVGGHLAVIPTVDQRDVYSITVPAGQVVTYSLASNYPGISLALTDALGNLIGPVLAPGEVANFTASAGTGTFYMSAARTSAVGDVGYVVGAIIGPEPSGCRPYCLDG